MAVDRMIVLGREITLPAELEARDVKEKVISILTDLEPDLVTEIEGKPIAIRIEGNTAVVYRTDAVFG